MADLCVVPMRTPHTKKALMLVRELLEFDLGTSCFELGLGFFCVFLGSTFEDGRGSALDEFFGVGKSESASDAADGLDDRDFLSASLSEDDVEFSLFLGGFSGGSGCSSGGGGSGGGDAPLFFEGFYKFSGFKHGEFAQFFS